MFLQSKGLRNKRSNVHCSNRVLEPSVIGAWKCQETKTKLLDASQSVKERKPQKVTFTPCYRYYAMDRILERIDEVQGSHSIQMSQN